MPWASFLRAIVDKARSTRVCFMTTAHGDVPLEPASRDASSSLALHMSELQPLAAIRAPGRMASSHSLIIDGSGEFDDGFFPIEVQNV